MALNPELLDMIVPPFFKRLADCTGEECAEAAAWFRRYGELNGYVPYGESDSIDEVLERSRKATDALIESFNPLLD